MIKKCLFPVAGYGTRFLPATKAIPKEMLPVVDKPLIQYAVEEAREAGIEEMIFVTRTRLSISIWARAAHQKAYSQPQPCAVSADNSRAGSLPSYSSGI